MEANIIDAAYARIVRRVLDSGDARADRTGVGTRSVFGETARFDLGAGEFPLITSKRVSWKTSIKEMIWFLTGGTNIRQLLEQDVRIWTDWPLKAYREATGEAIAQGDFEARIVADAAFAAEWGELGPVYGKQWRRWAGPDGVEHDQIAGVIEALKHNPASRRILFHAWNVPEIGAMALPPCHMVYQYHVTSDGRLNSLMFQRSCDVFLGLPFNWVGAAALQMMLAQQAGLVLGEFVWMGGDVHLYANHLDAARDQIARESRPAARVTLAARAGSIDEYAIGDFSVEGYAPHPAIKAEVAV